MNRPLGAETVTVTPYTGGWSNGDATATPGSTFNVVASVQPIGLGAEVDYLPEAARLKAQAVMIVYEGEAEINATDITEQDPSDRVSWHGDTYEVKAVADWTGHQKGIPHNFFALVRVGADE